MRTADEEVGSSLTLETLTCCVLESAAILKTLERLLHRDRLYPSIILSRKGMRAHKLQWHSSCLGFDPEMTE